MLQTLQHAQRQNLAQVLFVLVCLQRVNKYIKNMDSRTVLWTTLHAIGAMFNTILPKKNAAGGLKEDGDRLVP